MKKSRVTLISIDNNYKQSIDKTFQNFPDVLKKLKTVKKIFIKINIDHVYEYLHTDVELLQVTLEYIRRVNSAAPIYLMENNFSGNFTRLLANVTGFIKICKKYKLKFLFLDERKPTVIQIGKPESSYDTHFPEILCKRLISEREQSFYLNLARLKTHFSTKVAGGMFNQLGFLGKQVQRSIYSSHVHRLIVDLLRYIQPDFTLVEANVVLSHGFLTPENLIDKYAHCINKLVGGIDPVAVDRIGLALLGYKPLDIQYMKLAIEQNLGEGDLDYIELIGTLPSKPHKIPYMIELSQLPQRMDIVIGKNKKNIDNCLAIAFQFIQILHKDFIADRSFTLIVGNDFTKKQLENLRTPIVILGEKTCNELAPFMKEHYFAVYYIDNCAMLSKMMAVFLKVMKVSRYYLIGANPLTTWKYLLISKLRGSSYKLPSVTRKTRRWKIKKRKPQKKNRTGK